jgi:hypothetical protein
MKVLTFLCVSGCTGDHLFRFSAFASAQQWFFRRGGDPSGTQLRDPADELHRNGFGEWEMDRPLSQLIALEIIFERR